MLRLELLRILQMTFAAYKKLFKGFQNGQDKDGKPTYDDWLDYYKVGFRRMMGPTSERTLIWLRFAVLYLWTST